MFGVNFISEDCQGNTHFEKKHPKTVVMDRSEPWGQHSVSHSHDTSRLSDHFFHV